MKDQKVLIILPAYNAEATLKKTYSKIPVSFRQNVLLVDDASVDNTVMQARKLGINVVLHGKNLGYGANQKTCYKEAIKRKADIVVMVHPDYQYPPEMITPMVEMIKTGRYDCVLGSRILSGEALKGGMPLYKYLSNRFLTAIENIFTGAKLSEYHTGLRAYKVEILQNINFTKNSNDFVFDNQILLQILAKGYGIGEISSPCRYFPEASSINFIRSLTYGTKCLYWGFIYLLGRLEIFKDKLIFS
jgi:glycosyltransferase involved in cell wall biosynthesis